MVDLDPIDDLLIHCKELLLHQLPRVLLGLVKVIETNLDQIVGVSLIF